jgi:hypothetical protein
MLGLCMQINFHQVGGEDLYLYYPVILIGISVLLLFNPLKICYFRTRMWLLYSLVSTRITFNNTSTNATTVAPVARRHISCRMERLLSRRHVLLPDIQHECKSVRRLSNLSIDSSRVSHCSFVSTRTIGTTLPNVTHPTYASPESLVRCPVYGD